MILVADIIGTKFYLINCNYTTLFGRHNHMLSFIVLFLPVSLLFFLLFVVLLKAHIFLCMFVWHFMKHISLFRFPLMSHIVNTFTTCLSVHWLPPSTYKCFICFPDRFVVLVSNSCILSPSFVHLV